MNTKNIEHILLKRSSVLNKVPSSNSLEFGEVAVNYAASGETFYIKNASGSVVSMPTNKDVRGLANRVDALEETTDFITKTAEGTILDGKISADCQTFKVMSTSPVEINDVQIGYDGNGSIMSFKLSTEYLNVNEGINCKKSLSASTISATTLNIDAGKDEDDYYNDAVTIKGNVAISGDTFKVDTWSANEQEINLNGVKIGDNSVSCDYLTTATLVADESLLLKESTATLQITSIDNIVIGNNRIPITKYIQNPIIKIIYDDGSYSESDVEGALTSSSIPNIKNIKSIILSYFIKSLDASCFYLCTKLTNITMPSSVTVIGEGVLSQCTSLTSITMTNSVTRIGNGAFSNCTSLTDIYYKGTKAQWGSITKGEDWKFSVPSTCQVHCTDGDMDI